jgi:hypothetical protein
MSTLTDNEPVSGYVGPSGQNITLHDLADFAKKQKFTTKTDSYELLLTDQYHTILMNHGDGNTLTVPANATAEFDIGTVIGIIQIGAGQTTVVAAEGVTVSSSIGLLLKAQYSVATLTKIATNIWVLSGDLAAA